MLSDTIPWNQLILKKLLKSNVIKIKEPEVIHPNKIKVPWEIEQLNKMGCSEMICPKCKKSPMILLNVCSPQKSRDGPIKTDLAA